MGGVGNRDAEEDSRRDLNPGTALVGWNHAVLLETCGLGVPFAMELRKLESRV